MQRGNERDTVYLYFVNFSQLSGDYVRSTAGLKLQVSKRLFLKLQLISQSFTPLCSLSSRTRSPVGIFLLPLTPSSPDEESSQQHLS